MLGLRSQREEVPAPLGEIEPNHRAGDTAGVAGGRFHRITIHTDMRVRDAEYRVLHGEVSGWPGGGIEEPLLVLNVDVVHDLLPGSRIDQQIDDDSVAAVKRLWRGIARQRQFPPGSRVLELQPVRIDAERADGDAISV